MAFGIVNEGFVLKRLSDILTDMASDLSTVSDPVTGETLTPDLTNEDDPLVQIVNSVGAALAECWEQLQLAYNQFDPMKATGAGLKGTVQLNGIAARPSIRSTVSLTLTGTTGVSVIAGKQVSNQEGTVVFELPAFEFVAGSATVLGTATEDGALEAPSGTITKIVTPVPGWTGVTNAADASVGVAPETDEELRIRQAISTSATAAAIVEGIFSGVADLDGVTFCKVYQNITLETDVRGIPAKSIAVIVEGGVDAEIAEVIFNRNPLAGLHGTTTVQIQDIQGFQYPVKFSRPVDVDIYVAVAVTVVDVPSWPSNGADLIKAAIVDFSTSGARALGIPLGYDQNGYIVGESVYASELYVAIGSVLGIKITSVLVGTADPPASDSVAIDWDEVAVFDISRIDVTVT